MRSPRLLVTALALSALLAARAAGQEQTNPIVAQVKAVVKNPNRPFTMLVVLRVKEGAGDKLETAFVKAARATQQEKGNLAYDLNRDPKMPGRYLIYERWRNLAALEEHLKSRHITTLLAELANLLAAPPEVHVLVPAGEGQRNK